jgi:hypothetical protein
MAANTIKPLVPTLRLIGTMLMILSMDRMGGGTEGALSIRTLLI